MPAIKQESSPEPPLAAIAAASSSSLPGTLQRPQTASDRCDVKSSFLPPVANPYIVAKQNQLRSGAHQGSSPLPVFSRLPSRLGPTIATGRVNNAMAATTTFHTLTPQHPRFKHLTKRAENTRHVPQKNRETMDQCSLGSGDGFMDGSGFGTFPLTGFNEQADQTITVPRTALDELHYHVHVLQHAHAASEEKVLFQGGLITELVSFNERIHATVEDLHARLKTMETIGTPMLQKHHSAPAGTFPSQPAFNFRPSGDVRSRSPSPDHENYRVRDAPPRSRKARKNLAIKVPENKNASPAIGLPTPMTVSQTSSARTPHTPLTPGRIGPPDSSKKVATCITKRGTHGLDKMVPPAHAQVPFLPLTDTEIIVYFFNSLCRPIVSLRLYARGWGPAAISDCINSHRNIVPAYLRNTCSVKCTTAIKKGIDRYGEGWDIVNRAIFQSPDMTDDKATDLMKMRDDEFPHISDFDLRDLCDGLQKHPDEEDGGIFTRCVKYCQENNSPYFLSNVWELAQDLVAGRLPKGPRYLAPQDQNTAEQSTQRARREGSDDSVIGNEAESISRTSL